MSGSSNFLPWGGTTGPASNIETDAEYASDSQRSTGATVNEALPSNLGNKLFLQATMMAAGIGQMMATKGYTVSDANLTTLASVLANIITDVDLAASPALGGNPTATTQSTSDDSTRIATTAFVQALIVAVLQASVNNGDYSGFLPVSGHRIQLDWAVIGSAVPTVTLDVDGITAAATLITSLSHTIALYWTGADLDCYVDGSRVGSIAIGP